MENRAGKDGRQERDADNQQRYRAQRELICNNPGPLRWRRRHHFSQSIRIEFEPDRKQCESQCSGQESVLPHLGR